MSMLSLQPLLTALLDSLPEPPIEQAVLDEHVKKTITEARKASPSETRKSQWEYLLKNEVFNLAALLHPTTPKTDLKSHLNTDECEQTFPFIVLQDLLETQTIASCSHVFAWIEARAQRLTVDLKPQKGKALVLLRSLNDLLRRLSKTGSTTIFCGRILTFLSGVFPLGERSGVNLRGEYGPTWDGVVDLGKNSAKTEDVVPMLVEGEEKRVAKLAEKKEIYETFWSLQLPFSKPPLFANPETFPQFAEAVNKVLPQIKEATAKERAMMGSRTSSGTSLKRKRESNTDEGNTKANATEYFFAKFLTSPDLIDLEIADTHFRRQFLFQLLILLNHLLTFTKAAKAVWFSATNRALQMDFTLEGGDAQWVQETISKVMEELRQTAPNGRAFAEAVSVVLEREKNWVNWKNNLCSPFDKAPATFEVDGKSVGLFEATAAERQKMREPPEDYPWSHGSEALTEIWEMGCRGLYDLENPFQPGEVKDFVKKIKLEDHRIEMRKKTLARMAERKAAALAAHAAKSAAPSPAPTAETESSTRLVPVKAPEALTSTPSITLVPMDTSPVIPAPSLAAPRPVSAVGSPLHPSLPPKPGSSPIKPAPTPSQDLAKPAILAPGVPIVEVSTPASAPTPEAPTPAPIAPPVPVATPAPPEAKPDEQVLKLEENKHQWAWLALRTARDQYLQHFGKIGTGDIELLAKEIELERERLQKLEEAESANGGTSNGSIAGCEMMEGIDSPLVATVAPPLVGDEGKTDGEAATMVEGS
ncbi:hypothetical protein H0H81_006420 [Sphagnurus paluster]|uniref:THO complex subunit 1 n=1 Tax=Sphagnurus paluster TaxID=117069 RepID=A0A9P7KKU5_9AGAR|nr:hypothetical protein H0H81_006420 [Sphagnurus paluster]